MYVKNNNPGLLKFRISRLVLWLGIMFGSILTAFLWLDTSEQLYGILRWTGYVGITYLGIYLLYHNAHRRAFSLLVLFASVSVIYLFPELLGPACNGIPRALASPSQECITVCETVCTKWVPGPSAQCPNPGPGGGCCKTYGTHCSPQGCGNGTDLPPTITANLTCADIGNNGWCQVNDQLVLTVSDPQGYALTITGNAGWTISCNGSCTVNLPEGTGTASYTVTATTSGLTDSGSTAWKYDPNPPVPSLTLSGTSGSNGWYVSTVNATASGSDALSGLASASLSVDGGAAFSSAMISTNGVHSVQQTAVDNAGNSASTNATIKIDTTAPQINLGSVLGTSGANGWYVSAVQVSATALDATSGLASLSININGSWNTYISPVLLGNGIHTVQFRATDHAGNITTTSQIIKVDSSAPLIATNVAGTSGSNGWIISNAQVSASATDAGSGLGILKFAVDGNAWQVYAAPISLSDGLHTVQFQVPDNAGNSTVTSISVKVDTTAPQIVGNLTGTPGTNGWYVSDVTTHAIYSDLTSGIAAVKYRLDGGSWQSGTSILAALDGLHTVDFLALDKAGNQSITSRSFKIDQSLPAILFTPTGVMGNNDWYVSSVALGMLADDSVSAVSSFEYNQDGTGWQLFSSALTLTDGEHTIQVRAVDSAGNLATASISIDVDTVSPVQNLVLNGTSGSNNWYVSDVIASITTSDLTSGNVVTTIIDNGTAAQSDLITLTDDIHQLQYISVDAAGNSVTASAVVSVDTTAPALVFNSPLSNSVAIDTIAIGGQSTDLTSGVSETQISFDAVHWLSLPVSDNWSYVWQTADLPNGELTLFARSIDQAGNTGVAPQIKVVLDNHPPFLSLSDSWNIWEYGILSVEPNVTPLKSVRIVIHDPLQRYPDRVIYEALPAPATIAWDRILGPGSAPPGSYLVQVEVCDLYGLCSKDTGTILIPVETALPLQLPALDIPDWIPSIPILPMPEIERPIVLPPVVAPTLAPVTVTPSSIWNVVVISALLLAFAFLLFSDPRPSAWRSLTRRIAESLIPNS